MFKSIRAKRPLSDADVAFVQRPVRLIENKPRPAETPELYRPLADKITAGRKDSLHEEFTVGAIARATAIPDQQTYNNDYLTLRDAFMKQTRQRALGELIKSPVPAGGIGCLPYAQLQLGEVGSPRALSAPTLRSLCWRSDSKR